MTRNPPLLEVETLRTHLDTPAGLLRAVGRARWAECDALLVCGNADQRVTTCVFDHGVDAVDERRRRGGVVPPDVVEGDVAEAALLPVAAVGDRQLVPPPVAPQPVHRVRNVEHREIAVERQAVVDRRRERRVRADVPVDGARVEAAFADGLVTLDLAAAGEREVVLSWE